MRRAPLSVRKAPTTVTNRAIVCGHTSGLGNAIARRLLQDGWDVIGVSRSAAQLDGITEISEDLSDHDGVARTLATIRKRYRRFDAFVYCAGMLYADPLERLRFDLVEQLYRLNLFAPMALESSLLPAFRRNGTDVVNITSSSIDTYYPAFAAYASAKAALAKFTDDLRRALEDSSARVIEVRPSGFTSCMYATMAGERIPREESRQIDVHDLANYVVDALSLPKRMEIGLLRVNRKP